MNFRRYLERKDVFGNKDYEDYTKNINEEMYETKTQFIQKTTPDMATTLCSKTGSDFFNNRKTARQARFSMTGTNFNPEEAEVKPKLLESKIVNKQSFFSLSNGFQKVFANERDKKLSIPIAGYSGHVRGDKAQNYFGKTFRDTAIQSKRLERSLQR